MVYRKIGDQGPFYRLFREGVIEHFDGFTIPDAHLTTRNILDLNRNFPQDWKAHHEQYGAGDFPGSAPESRAIQGIRHAASQHFRLGQLPLLRRRLSAAVRGQADHKMNPLDLEMRRAGQNRRDRHRLPHGFELPRVPLQSRSAAARLMVEWAYQQRGAVAMVCELWDLFKRVDKEVKPFIDNYVNLDDAFMAKYYDWDKKTMAAPASRPGNASSIRSSARWNWAASTRARAAGIRRTSCCRKCATNRFSSWSNWPPSRPRSPSPRQPRRKNPA